MKLTKKPSEVLITFKPNEYCLMRCEDKMLGDYALHYLIDRSEKGKSPDIGVEVLYLEEKEAQVFKEAGFVVNALKKSRSN